MPERTPRDRIDHARSIRTEAIQRRNLKALAELLAREYRLCVISTDSDRFTLGVRE